MRGGIHLAAADDLVVGGFEVEVKFAIAGLFLFVALIRAAVGLDRGNATFGRGLGLVQLTGKNDLAIARLENEAELAVTAVTQLKPSCHRNSLLRR
ncbi:hypothetical protein D3C84_1015890 [compost metagenome]